jgi:CPA2 family monovalent cation:H+ antiporter-2
MDRGELGALHGRVALGILIAQDLAVVPMVVVLPSIAGGGDQVLLDLFIAAVKAAAVLIGAYLIGIRLVPFALGRAAITRTRELFLVGVVALALGTATVAACRSLAGIWRIPGWPSSR